MEMDLSVLDEPQNKRTQEMDLSVLDKPKMDLSVLDEPPPSLGQIGTGLVAEVAIGESAKFAGATAGALVGGPAGALIGYVSGGIGGGITGSIAAQKSEGRDDISWGRVTADTLLNLMPFGSGKATKTAKTLPKLVNIAKGQGIAGRGVMGAGISAGALQVEKAVEEGEFLTKEELLSSAGVGAGLGLGLGVLGKALNGSYNRLRGKSTDEITNLYKGGNHDANAVIDAITGGDPQGKVNRFGRIIGQHILPTQIIGERASRAVRNALNMSDSASDIGAQAQKRIDSIYKDLNQDERRLLDLYMEGKSTALPPRAIKLKETIDDTRELIGEYQEKVMTLYDKGYLDMNPLMAEKIRNSQLSGDYFTRDYKFFEDKRYRPTEKQTNDLRVRLMRDGHTRQESDGIIQKLNDARNTDDIGGGLDVIASTKSVLKRKRENMPREMEEYLGLIKEPGERVFSTMSKLGKLAAIEGGKVDIAESLLKTGLARSGMKVRADVNLVPLKIRGTEMRTNRDRKIIRVRKKDGDIGLQDKTNEGDIIYVPREVNNAINQSFNSRIPQETATITENFITKILSTTTGASKFVKVPLSLAAYPVQVFGNAIMVLGQGMNPFRGIGKGLKVAGREVAGKKFSLKEMEEYKRLGLVDKDTKGSDLRNAIRRGYGPESAKGLVDRTGKVYSFFDTAQRVSVFENYKKMFKNMNPNIEEQIGTKRFNELSAELTNSTYQNYDRISPSIRYLSRLGILNEFISFTAELSRTTVNQGRLAKQMLDGSFAKKIKQEYGVSLDGAALRNQGLKRVAAMTAMLSAATAGIVSINRARGISAEEEKQLRETVVPEWDRNSALVFRKDGDKVSMTNVSYTIPIAELTSIFEAGLRGENPSEVIGNSMQAMTDKFFGGGTMNIKNLINAIQNRDPKTGRVISASPNTSERLFDLAQYYTSETFTPGIVNDIRKWDERTGKELGARYLLGLRTFNTSIDQGAGYRFREAKDNIRTLRVGYSSSLFDKDADASQLYNKFNNDYRANGQFVMDRINDLRGLGKTDAEIKSILKKSQVDSNIVNNTMVGIVPDMNIAVGISGTKPERVRKYVDLFNRLPRELAVQMIQQEVQNKKINTPTLITIKRLIDIGG